VIITKLQVAPVELDVSSQSSSTCRASRARRVERVELCCSTNIARHSQNAWARHVECVESSRVEPSGIWASAMPAQHTRLYEDILVNVAFITSMHYSVFGIRRVRRPTCGYLPSFGASPHLHWYHLKLHMLAHSDTWAWAATLASKKTIKLPGLVACSV